MSTLYITEFGAQARDQANFVAPIASLPALTTQVVTISGVSAQSSAFGANTAMIRLISDVVCSVIVSASPTATTSHMRLTADSAEYLGVPMGSSFKIAVIANV